MNVVYESNEKIAILIPCYNAAMHLPYLFQGIKAQTIPFDEIICYDDNSTDNTIEVAEQLGATVLKGLANRGAAYGRNRLLEHTNCNWVHFHDADDLIDPLFVFEFKEALKKVSYSEDTCFLSNMNVINENNELTAVVEYDSLETTNDYVQFFLLNNGFAIIGCYPRKLLQKINGFREDLRGNEDPDLHIRLALEKTDFKPLKKSLVSNVISGSSFSNKNWSHCLADKLKCLERYFEITDKRYHTIIGRQAAELSNYFYREGDCVLSKRARLLASKTDINILPTSRFSKYCSMLLGWKFYLWLYRRRVDFRLT